MKLIKSVIIIINIAILRGLTNAYYHINSYNIKGDIQIDGTIKINEEIGVQFDSEMHGIERSLPRYYNVEDTEFQVLYDDINVNNDNFTTYNEYGDTIIRIGDKDKTIKGIHNYNIEYSVYGIIKNFSGKGYSELYRNVIGYDRDVNIKNSLIELHLPKSYTGFTKDDFLISAGKTSKSKIDDFPGLITRDENKITIEYTGNLSPYNGITLAVKLPNDYFEYDHNKQADLFVGYIRDYKVENNKIYGTVHKNGTIDFKNNIKLLKYRPIEYLDGIIPYNYDYDGRIKLIKINNLKINGYPIKYKEYDTTNKKQYVSLSGFKSEQEITPEYTIFGLIKTFTGEDIDWAYKIYLPLPLFSLNECSDNIELTLEFPEPEFSLVCSGIYREDVEIELGGRIHEIDDFYNEGGKLRCEENTLYLDTNNLHTNNDNHISINMTDLGFELDNEQLDALEKIGNGEFYFKNEFNRESIIFFIGMLFGCGGFMRFMNNRYKTLGKDKPNYIVEYSAPKGIDAPEAGAIIDDIIDNKDITALIYQRAATKYIKICRDEERSKGYYIKKLKDLPSSTKQYQLELFNNIFKEKNTFRFYNIDSYSKHTTFTKLIKNAKSDLKSYINDENRYNIDFDYVSGCKNDFKTTNKFFVGCTTVLRLVIYSSVVTLINSHLKPVWSGIVLTVIIGTILILTSYKRKDKETNTEKGNELLKQCLGYKKFLMKVDKEKFETLTKEDPLFVDKALPYAIAFGIETQLIKYITPENIDRFDGDLKYLGESIKSIKSEMIGTEYSYSASSSSSSSSSYSSSSGYSSGSSFSGGYSSGGGGGGGGGRGW